MTWFRVDDSFYQHPKVLAIGNAATGLWLRCGTYSAQHLTDGFIPAAIATSLGTRREVTALVTHGLWVQVNGGYVMHDWLDYQPSRDQVRADREAARERQRKLREQQRQRATGDTPDPRPATDVTANVTADVTANVTADVTANVTANVQRESHPPRPVPSRSSTYVDLIAAAALPADDPLPPQLRPLRDTCQARGLTVRWDKLTAEHRTEISRLLSVHGPQKLADHAARQHQPDNPAATAQAWLPAWQQLPAVQPVPEQCPDHGQPQPCRGCAADRKAGAA